MTPWDVAMRALVVDVVREVLAEERRAPTHVTVAAFARRLSVSERTVRDAIREGRLEHVRIGRAVRIPADAKIAPRIDEVTERARLKLLGGGR